MKTYEVKVSRVRETKETFMANTPQCAVDYWKNVISKSDWYDPEREMAVVLILNTRYRIMSHALVSIGTMNESIVHPRDVFRAAIALGAYGVILMHNHPSGDVSVSGADINVTNKMKDAAKILSIQFLDHIVVGTAMDEQVKHFSFKEAGYLHER